MRNAPDFARQAEEYRGKGDVLLFREDLGADGVRRLTIALTETCGGRAAVFGGGGHPGAAGCRIEAPLEEAEAMITAAVGAHLKELGL